MIFDKLNADYKMLYYFNFNAHINKPVLRKVNKRYTVKSVEN